MSGGEQIRNPKAEIRKKAEIRNPKAQEAISKPPALKIF